MSTQSSTGRSWPADLDDETAEFFERTVGSWQCRDCGTEFTVDGVFAVQGGREVGCPLCGTSRDALSRGGSR